MRQEKAYSEFWFQFLLMYCNILYILTVTDTIDTQYKIFTHNSFVEFRTSFSI